MATATLAQLVSDESIGFLGEAKKGKPRRFVLVNKGAKVVSLVVYKVGSLSSYKKEAKAAGKGEVCHGVITGKGVNISFQLARSDGFDTAPTKNAALKQFLAENTDEKFKPVFEIVDALPEVSDEVEAATGLADSAPTPDTSQPAASERSALQLEFAARLKEIAPRAVPFSKAGGPHAVSVATLLKGVQADRQSDELAAGLEKLQQIEQFLNASSPVEDDARARFEVLLKELAPQAMPIAQGGGPQAAEMTGLLKAVHSDRKGGNFAAGLEKLAQVQAILDGSASRPADDDAKQQFLARLKELAPQAIPVSKSDSPVAAQLAALLKAVKEDGNQNQFSAGLEKLARVEQLLAVPPAPPSDSLKTQFENLLRELAPQAVKLVKAIGPHAAELTELLKAVQADRQSESFESGMEKLNRVREILAADSPAARDFTQQRAAFENAKNAWQAAIEQVGSQVEKLSERLRNAIGDQESEELKWIAEFGLPALTKHFRVPLAAAILDIQKASDESVSSLAANGITRASGFLDHLATDSAIDVVDANPFRVTVTMRSTLEPALKALRDAFQSFVTP